MYCGKKSGEHRSRNRTYGCVTSPSFSSFSFIISRTQTLINVNFRIYIIFYTKAIVYTLRSDIVLSVIGFLTTMFAYLGLNLLLSGLHSYGNMQQGTRVIKNKHRNRSSCSLLKIHSAARSPLFSIITNVHPVKLNQRKFTIS